MLSELDVLKEVTARLDTANIEYMLTGSMALNCYAEPRMTRDIDIVVALGAGDAVRIRKAFGSDYYLPAEELERAIASAGMFNIVHLESVIKVDFIVRKNEPYRETEFARRSAFELPGFRVWITSKEDLVLSKLLWAKDSGSELQMRDVRNLLATGADMAYLNDWAKRLGVADAFKEALDG